MSDQLIAVALSLPEIKPQPGFARHTSLLTASHACRSHVPLMFMASGMKKGADLGTLFADVAPKQGKLTLELGVVLPNVLPDVDNLSECTLKVRALSQIDRDLCLSNRMSRFHFFESEEPWQCLMPRTSNSLSCAKVRRGKGKFVPAIEEVLPTVAAMRFEIAGETAEEAFQANIRASVDDLLACVNVILEAARATSSDYRPISRLLSWDSVASVYALVSNGDRAHIQPVALNGGWLAMRPGTLRDREAVRFRDFGAGTLQLTDVDRLLGEARSSWQTGEYEFAFLQAVIAAEIETRRTVRAECQRRGVSKAKLDDNRRDLTYSWALNIGLPLAFDEPVRPPVDLLAEMNSARRRRNALMHEAAFVMTRDEVRSLIERTREFVSALRTAAAAAGTPAASRPS